MRQGMHESAADASALGSEPSGQPAEHFTVAGRRGGPIADAQRSQTLKDGLKKTVACLASDGICLMDDVGGIHGFCHFLENLKTGDPEDRAEMKEWAADMGWTGKEPKAESLL